jgi:hypothetical protein
MSNRRAIATQADVSRAIRAAQKAGLTVVRVIVREDGIAVETAEGGEQAPIRRIEPEREVVL